MTYLELWAGWDGEDLVSYRIDSTGEERPPSIEILFANSNFLSTGNLTEGACTWTGELTIIDETDMGMQGDFLWVGFELALSLIETDCADFDPAVWGDDTPTAVYESNSLMIGFGPLGNLENILSSDEDWMETGKPYYFASYWGPQVATTSGEGAIEGAYGLAYEMNAQNTIELNEDGTPQQVEIEDEMPEGVVRMVAQMLLALEEPSL